MSATPPTKRCLRILVDRDTYDAIAGGRQSWAALPLTQWWTSRLLFREFDTVTIIQTLPGGGITFRCLGVVSAIPLRHYMVSLGPKVEDGVR